MASAVAKHEGKAGRKDVPARERYKSRREDRKPGFEEIETLRTDQIFTKRSDSIMAVRTCSLIVDPRLPESALFSQVSGVCKALLRKWADVDDSNISVSKITGGITNMLLKAEVEGENESQLPPVTVRVFGPNTDAVIDRDRELQALTYLSSAGFGAKLLGVFGNGMIQSFIVGRTLEPLDMGKPELAKLIAVEVRRLHGLEIPGSKEPLLWQDINKFIDKASLVSFEDSEKQKTYETISFDSLGAEVEELRAISDSFNAPIVFAHNDLLSGNFMLNEDEGKLFVIDYEYGSHSYRGYDIANYFNEHAGFECDYSLYPDKEKQFYFFRHYLHPENTELTTEAELEELYAECNFYSLASHMYWATWAIVQVKEPTITCRINMHYMAFCAASSPAPGSSLTGGVIGQFDQGKRDTWVSVIKTAESVKKTLNVSLHGTRKDEGKDVCKEMSRNRQKDFRQEFQLLSKTTVPPRFTREFNPWF